MPLKAQDCEGAIEEAASYAMGHGLAVYVYEVGEEEGGWGYEVAFIPPTIQTGMILGLCFGDAPAPFPVHLN